MIIFLLYSSSNALMAQPIPSMPIPLPLGICLAFVILFWKSCKCPTVGPGIHTKIPRWGLKLGYKCPTPGQFQNCISSKLQIPYYLWEICNNLIKTHEVPYANRP